MLPFGPDLTWHPILVTFLDQVLGLSAWQHKQEPLFDNLRHINQLLRFCPEMYFLHEKRPPDDITDDNLGCTFWQHISWLGKMQGFGHQPASTLTIDLQILCTPWPWCSHVLRTLPDCIGCCNTTLLYLWACLSVHDVPKYIFIQDFFANLALALTTRLVLGSLLGIRTILGPPPQNLPIELAGEAKSPSSWLGRKSEGEIWARRRRLGGHYHPIRTTSQPQQCPTLILQSTTPRY